MNVKSLTFQVTPAVYDALLEAVVVVNQLELEVSREEHKSYSPLTVEEFIEECVLVSLTTRKLLKRGCLLVRESR